MMKRSVISCGLLLLLAACGTHAGSSGAPQSQAFGRWQVKVAHAGKPDALCYTGTVPFSSSGPSVANRKTPYLMATRRLSGKIEVSVSAGYPYAIGHRVTLLIDNKPYHLFSHGSVAWAHTDSEDATIIHALMGASSIAVRANPQSGGTTIDTYSPDGFGPALLRVKQLCP